MQAFPLDGSAYVGFSATGVVSRKEFGADFNVPLAAGGFVIGDRVEIVIDAQFVPESESGRLPREVRAGALKPNYSSALSEVDQLPLGRLQRSRLTRDP